MKQKLGVHDVMKLGEALFEIPTTYRADMQVSARIFAQESILADIVQDRSLWQLVNVTTLPGIVHYAMAMPDMHEGYGFPIGGVAACDVDAGGVISPGGIGYDINCGVRLLASQLRADEIVGKLPELATALWHAVPSGVGEGGSLLLNKKQLEGMLRSGAQQLVEQGFGTADDALFCEENGSMQGADPALVSDRAKERGLDQLGTLGSGNHFLELQKVQKIFDPQAAHLFGLYENHVVIMIHCGSRGLGHQVCTDYVRIMMRALQARTQKLPDPELVYAPFSSMHAQEYFGAMQAAANFAWANRHKIGHEVRTVWQRFFGSDAQLTTVYDLSHNMGKLEHHTVAGKQRQLLVHRKGATRAFGPGRPEIPEKYRAIGQPVFIPGTMGTASYVLVGTAQGMETAFGSSCHGAGRRLSRAQAKKEVHGSTLRKDLEKQGIVVRCESNVGLAEEAPCAYKDVESVVASITLNKLALPVARLVPLAVIKG